MLLEIGHQLLELHATDLGLQLLREVLGHLLLLANQLDNNQKHEVDKEDSSLHDVFLGLREAFGRVPSGPLEEEVMDAAVQFAVQLAQVLASIPLSNPVLLPLVIGIDGDHAPLALASTHLLQGGLAVDVSGCDQTHDFVLRKFSRPFGFLCGK